MHTPQWPVAVRHAQTRARRPRRVHPRARRVSVTVCRAACGLLRCASVARPDTPSLPAPRVSFTLARDCLFLLLLLLLLFSAVSKQKMPKTRVKPENTWGFPGIFGYYPHCVDAGEIVVGHCQAFLIVVQPA